MITMKQRGKSYRVAQRDAGMRAARKISVRNLRENDSVLSVNYPERSKQPKEMLGKEVRPVLKTGSEALFLMSERWELFADNHREGR